jgi:collagenase-like PrtC family protease
LDKFDGGALVDISVAVNYHSVDAAWRWLSKGRERSILSRILVRAGQSLIF